MSNKHDLVIQSLHHLNRELFDLLQGVIAASMPLSIHADPSGLSTDHIDNLTQVVGKAFSSGAYIAAKSVYERNQGGAGK